MSTRSRSISLGLLLTFSLVGGAALVAACVGDPEPAAGNPTDDGGTTSEASPTTDGGMPSEAGCDGSVCSAACVDLKNDSHNCGGCGVICAADAGAVFACVQGACGNKAVQVTTGTYGSCALLLDGTVWCWGKQTGGTTGMEDPTPTPTPRKIAITGAVEIGMGNSTACARKGDGTVWCWGGNDFGELGHATGSDPGCAGTCSPTPVQITIPVKAAQLTVAWHSVCVRGEGATGGDVYCWGSSADGILGDIPDSGTGNPTPKKIPVFLGDVIDVSLGQFDNGAGGDKGAACALRNDHTVWCWGTNYGGGLGHATGTNGDIPCGAFGCNPTPMKVPSLAGIAKVATGSTFACALTTAGAMWCWGFNSNGYLGTGNLTASVAPVQVTGLNTTVGVGVGDLSVFAIDSAGGVKSWGVNAYGELALGTYAGTACADFICAESAQSVPLLQGVSQISVAFLHGLAIKPDGTILSWGDNDDARGGHAPGTHGDSFCGPSDSGACNPTPNVVDVPWR